MTVLEPPNPNRFLVEPCWVSPTTLVTLNEGPPSLLQRREGTAGAGRPRAAVLSGDQCLVGALQWPRRWHCFERTERLRRWSQSGGRPVRRCCVRAPSGRSSRASRGPSTRPVSRRRLVRSNPRLTRARRDRGPRDLWVSLLRCCGGLDDLGGLGAEPRRQPRRLRREGTPFPTVSGSPTSERACSGRRSGLAGAPAFSPRRRPRGRGRDGPRHPEEPLRPRWALSSQVHRYGWRPPGLVAH